MADVSVEFGARDTGLERTLKTIQRELNELQQEVTSGELSFKELQQTWKKIEQGTRLETNIRQVATATDVMGDQAQQTAGQLARLDKEMDDVARNSVMATTATTSLKESWGAFTTKLAGAYAAILAFRGAFDFVDDAVMRVASLNESIDKTGVVFGEAQADIIAFSNSANSALAMTRQEALDAASTFGVFARSAGLTADESATFSKRLTILAADLASLYDAQPEEAILALGAALRGENEPIRRFGVLLDDATLRQQALKMGLIETTKEALTPQQKVLAAYNEVIEQTTIAHGNLEDTQGSLSNKMKFLTAEFDTLKLTIGQGLSPAFEGVVDILRSHVIPAVGGASQTIIDLIDNLGVGINAIKNFGSGAGGAEEETGILDKALGTVATSLDGFNRMMHDAFTTFTPFGYLMQTLANNTNEYKNATDNASEGSEEMEKAISNLRGETDGIGRSTQNLTQYLIPVNAALAGIGGEAEGATVKFDELDGTITETKKTTQDAGSAFDYAQSQLGDLGSVAAALKPKVDPASVAVGELANNLKDVDSEKLNLLEIPSSFVSDVDLSKKGIDDIGRGAGFAVGELGNLNSAANGLPEPLGASVSLLDEGVDLWGQQNSAAGDAIRKMGELISEDEKRIEGLRDQDTLQLAIAQAIAGGNTELATTLRNQQTHNGLLEEAKTKLQMTDDEAAQYAQKWMSVKGEVFTVKNKLDEIAGKNLDVPVLSLRQRSQEAKNELIQILNLIGVDLKNASDYDILKELGIDTFNLNTSEKKVEALERAVKSLSNMPAADLTPIVDSGDTRKNKIEALMQLAEEADGKGGDITPKVDEQKVKAAMERAMTAAGEAIESGGQSFPDIKARVEVDQQEVKGAIQTMVADIKVNAKGGDASGGDGGEGGEGGEGGRAYADDDETTGTNPIEEIKIAVQTIVRNWPVAILT
jgi:tetratricopeptide (TPR) repeat protein